MDEKYYWKKEDGTLVPVHELTNYHICNIVMKFGKDWLHKNGHSIIADKFESLNKEHKFFNVVDVKKTKFCDIKDKYIAIRFLNGKQLNDLVDYLKAYGYVFGTGKDNDLDGIKELGFAYFSEKYLSLDRSKEHCTNNYCSCGLGYRDKLYDFKDIDWNVT